jgi:hypothetical protein
MNIIILDMLSNLNYLQIACWDLLSNGRQLVCVCFSTTTNESNCTSGTRLAASRTLIQYQPGMQKIITTHASILLIDSLQIYVL